MINLNDLTVETSDSQRPGCPGRRVSFLNSLHYDSNCPFFLDFLHDPYSIKNPKRSICSRGDLLIPAVRIPAGCYDTKVRSRGYALANNDHITKVSNTRSSLNETTN